MDTHQLFHSRHPALPPGGGVVSHCESQAGSPLEEGVGELVPEGERRERIVRVKINEGGGREERKDC